MRCWTNGTLRQKSHHACWMNCNCRRAGMLLSAPLRGVHAYVRTATRATVVSGISSHALWHAPVPCHFTGRFGDYEDLDLQAYNGQFCVAVMIFVWCCAAGARFHGERYILGGRAAALHGAVWRRRCVDATQPSAAPRPASSIIFNSLSGLTSPPWGQV